MAEREEAPPAEPSAPYECRGCVFAQCERHPSQRPQPKFETEAIPNSALPNYTTPPSAKIDFGFDTPDTAPPVRRSL